MAKSRDAFRTISEVSDALDTPAHVLRFWESKFSQVKPVKRAGGRRYYRPDDLSLLAGVKTLLHDQGMTIKGVQKLLREKGIKHVAGISPSPLDVSEGTGPVIETTAIAVETPAPESVAAPVADQPTAKPKAPAAVPLPTPAAEILATPRFFAAFTAASPDRVRAKAGQIAPLVARLEAVRDRMRAN